MSKNSRRRNRKQSPDVNSVARPASTPALPSLESAPSGTIVTAPPIPTKAETVPADTVSISPRRLPSSAVTAYASTYSGPVPPPEILAGYDHLHPGAAGMILDLYME